MCLQVPNKIRTDTPRMAFRCFFRCLAYWKIISPTQVSQSSCTALLMQIRHILGCSDHTICVGPHYVAICGIPSRRTISKITKTIYRALDEAQSTTP